MSLKKNLLLFLSAVLITNKCFANSNMHVIGIEDLICIFYIGCGISALAVILCSISYFSGSKALNIIAWVAGILSIITSQVIMHTDYSVLSVIIPSLCLMILLARMGKSRTGTSFLIVYLLKSIACLIVIFNAGKMILEMYMPDFLAAYSYPYQIFLVLFFNAVPGFLVYKLLKQPPEKKNSLEGISLPVLMSILIGMGAYFSDTSYMIILSHSRRYHIDLSFLLFHIPYLNIFINLFCWVVTGLIVYGLYSSKQKKIQRKG